MSVVIAIKDKKKNKIIMGCDSQVSFADIKKNISLDSVQKISYLDEYKDILVGGCGYARTCQIILCSKDIIPYEPYMKNQLDFKWMVHNLFDNVYEVCKKYNRVDIIDSSHYSNRIDSNFIFAIKDNMYQMNCDGYIETDDDYLVIGSGAEVAIGVLENNKNKKPEDRIIEAINFCSDKGLYVGGDIKIFTT